ncbi:hypothetical protein LCGC14_0194530 [marine sediment metagenome]|uniref:Uncharacterized protein n=1 Tax=marine sediment metagenome TaxID=412755 RepID=A0A0F9X454_9ZZZZ
MSIARIVGRNNKTIWILILILLFSSAQFSSGDNITGTWQLDPNGFRPVFTEYEDFPALIVPGEDALFQAKINDIDNSSAELSITIYSSNDTFSVYNDSTVMSFIIEDPADIFEFTFNWLGENASTYYDFYYVAFDGISYVRSSNPSYYSIQWQFADVADVGVGGLDSSGYAPVPEVFDLGGATETEKKIISFLSILFFILAAILLFLLIDNRMKKRAHYSKKIVKGKVKKKRKKNKRKFRVAQGKKFI